MLVLTHLGGMVSTTSSVVFYPFVATYSPVYTSALSTGEGLSGSMAALLGIIQEPYDEASMRFSVGVFYMVCGE
jgi:riboflavin transporter 2